VDTARLQRKRTTEEQLEKGSEERNVVGRLQYTAGKDGGGSTKTELD